MTCVATKTLVLGHTGANLCRPASKERAIRDIATAFEGEIIFGEKGMVLDLWR